MDSLTHLVLGAAIGEATFGKKLGNRALLWGAIGHTIPDLDVFGSFFLNELDAAAFHRGITHSIVFAAIAPFFIAYGVHRLYASGTHATKGYKAFISVINIIALLGMTFGLNYMFRQEHMPNWIVLAITLMGSGYLLFRLYKYYWKKDLELPNATYQNWFWLFFLTISTHILIDSFTAYGTQVFQPFRDTRIAFDNLAIVDLLYTLPFMICVIIMASMKRNTRARTMVNWIGIILSSLYLLFTFYNKSRVDKTFERALENRGIEYQRYRTTPSILNNILWECVAEDKENFYVGEYSLFDSNRDLHLLNKLEKNDSIRTLLGNEADYKTIYWLASGYLTEFPTDTGLFLCDIRYGGFSDTINDHADMFLKYRVMNENGKWTFSQFEEPFRGSIGEELGKMWKRIKGY